MSLSVSDLRAFTLVVHERSVSAAAVKLGVSQQSVSERIRRIEARLGVDLFKRLSHGMEPTGAGYRLLPYAQRTVSLVDQAIDAVAAGDQVRMWVHSPVAGVAMPFLADVLRDTAVDVHEEPEADRVLSAVMGGTADIGIGSFSEPPPALTRRESPALDLVTPGLPALSIESLFADPVVCVAPAGHPLADDLVRLSDISARGIKLELDLAGDPERDSVRVCARSTVAERLASGEMVELRVVDWPTWAVPISMAYRSSDNDRPFIQALRAAPSHIGGLAASGLDAMADVEEGLGAVAVDPRFSRGVA